MFTNPKQIRVSFITNGDSVTANTPGDIMLKFAEMYWWRDDSITETVKRLNQQISEAKGQAQVYDTPWEVLRGLQNSGFITILVDDFQPNESNV